MLPSLIVALVIPADPTCYQVSKSPDRWSKTPETLCVEPVRGQQHKVVFATGLPMDSRAIATFDVDLLSRARCTDCIDDKFGVANPENSSLNALSIRIEAKRDMKTGVVNGTVKIGANKLFLRSIPGTEKPMPAPQPPPATEAQ